MGTRGKWALDFLAALGNPTPSTDTVKFVAAWTRGEGTAAKYNPLATTQGMPGASDFNPVGVKNYVSREQGIAASVKTVQSNFSGYAALRKGLLTNNPELSLAGGGLETWGTGSAAVAAIYRASDTRSEGLASESAGEGGVSLPSTNVKEDRSSGGTSIPFGPGTSSGGYGFGTEQNKVTSSDIIVYGKYFLAVILIGIALLMLLSFVARSETVQKTVTTAAKVAVTKGVG